MTKLVAVLNVERGIRGSRRGTSRDLVLAASQPGLHTSSFSGRFKDLVCDIPILYNRPGGGPQVEKHDRNVFSSRLRTWKTAPSSSLKRVGIISAGWAERQIGSSMISDKDPKERNRQIYGKCCEQSTVGSIVICEHDTCLLELLAGVEEVREELHGADIDDLIADARKYLRKG